jgi:hypothetical protein
LRMQGAELVTVRSQHLECELRVGGIVLGVTQTKRFAILRQVVGFTG